MAFCCTIVGINTGHCTQKSSQEFLFFAKNDWDMRDLIFREETEKTVIGRFPSWCQNPVSSISLFSAKSGQTSNRKVPCLTNKVLEWYKHVLQIHNFPWWQDQSYSSANYIHCSTELSCQCSQFTNSQSMLELSLTCVRINTGHCTQKSSQEFLFLCWILYGASHFGLTKVC